MLSVFVLMNVSNLKIRMFVTFSGIIALESKFTEHCNKLDYNIGQTTRIFEMSDHLLY